MPILNLTKKRYACIIIHIGSIRRKRQKSSTPGIERPSVGLVFAEPPAAVLDTSEHPHHSHERAVYFCLFVRRKCYGLPVGPVSTYYRPRGLSDLHARPSRRCESPLSRARCQDVAQLKAALDFSSQPMPSVARTVGLQHNFLIGRLPSTSQRSKNRDITKYFFFVNAAVILLDPYGDTGSLSPHALKQVLCNRRGSFLSSLFPDIVPSVCFLNNVGLQL